MNESPFLTIRRSAGRLGMLATQPLSWVPNESSSPYINRFLSADTIVPGYANPQNLNRYSYVTNNPLRYTDPSGHMQCEDYQGGCLSENQVTKINKIKGDRIKERSRRKNMDKDGIVSHHNEVTIGPMPITMGPALPSGTLPSVIIQHPFDSNVVSQVGYYDYTYFPRKPIGRTTTFYKMDGDIAVDPYALLGIGAGEITSSAIKRFVVGGLKKQLEGLGMTLAGCPECTALYEGYQLASNVAAINNAITVESHLRTETVLYPPPNPFVPSFPDLYRKIE